MNQTESLYHLLKDGQPHRTDEIIREVYNMDQTSVARIGARIWDIKKKYGVEIESFKDKAKKGLWNYRLVKNQLPSLSCGESPSTPSILCECGGYFSNKLSLDRSFFKCSHCGIYRSANDINFKTN